MQEKRNIRHFFRPRGGLAEIFQLALCDYVNLKRGSSITYLDSLLILSSKIEDVVIVVWGEITKSVQRVYDFSTWWVMSLKDNSTPFTNYTIGLN